jgi:hypothetical protein
MEIFKTSKLLHKHNTLLRHKTPVKNHQKIQKKAYIWSKTFQRCGFASMQVDCNRCKLRQSHPKHKELSTLKTPLTSRLSIFIGWVESISSLAIWSARLLSVSTIDVPFSATELEFVGATILALKHAEMCVLKKFF